jgi:hypothetical protein
MRPTWWIGTAVICFGVTTAAQNPPAPAPGTSTPPTVSSSAPAGAASGQTTVMTVTGCLQRAERPSASGAPRSAGEPGTSGGAATGIRNDAEQFTLSNVTNRAISGNATSASAPDIKAESSYLLQGQTEDLRAHVGHQVEVTAMQVAMTPNNQGDVRPGTAVGTSGTAAPAPAPVAGAAATTGTPETAANPDTSKSSTVAAATGTRMPTALMVQSVRMLAASCEPAKP